MDSDKIIERSVDSLHRIYAVIVAISVGQSINLVFTNQDTQIFELSAVDTSYIPVFLSFILVVVPFYHGMNRHLDEIYISRRNEAKQGALLFDFFVFFIEASLLFAFAASVRNGKQAFIILALVLVTDVIWSLISHWIHYRGIEKSVVKWSIINSIALFLGIFVYFINIYDESVKTWLLMIVVLGRTVSDYRFCWYYYFPQE